MSTTADTLLAEPAHVRSAVPADAEWVFSLLGQLASEFPSDKAAFLRNFAYLVDDTSTSILLVSASGDSIIGYTLTTITPLLYTNGSSAQIQELVVDSEHHGMGVGTLLVESIEQICRDRGVKQLTVPSRRSAAFYERIGYRSTADFLKRTF